MILSYITAPYLHDSKFRKAAEKNGTFYNVLPDLEDGIQDAAFKVRMRRLLQKAIYAQSRAANMIKDANEQAQFLRSEERRVGKECRL